MSNDICIATYGDEGKKYILSVEGNRASVLPFRGKKFDSFVSGYIFPFQEGDLSIFRGSDGDLFLMIERDVFRFSGVNVSYKIKSIFLRSIEISNAQFSRKYNYSVWVGFREFLDRLFGIDPALDVEGRDFGLFIFNLSGNPSRRDRTFRGEY